MGGLQRIFQHGALRILALSTEPGLYASGNPVVLRCLGIGVPADFTNHSRVKPEVIRQDVSWKRCREAISTRSKSS